MRFWFCLLTFYFDILLACTKLIKEVEILLWLHISEKGKEGMLTIYILMNSSIVKLPVSFYAIMLNISDTLNLLIPVFIFWLDNCINRTPERGYFRDKSNFLWSALVFLKKNFI